MKFSNKKDINKFIFKVAEEYGKDVAAKLLNDLMNTGFLLATLIGQTIPYSDFKPIPVAKAKTLSPKDYDRLRKEAIERYKEISTPDNQILYTTKIGAARGYDNIVNMFTTRGYFVNALDKYIDEPVVSSLMEGVDKNEFYNYGNAARKGIMDRVKFTAQPGYLFRQLIYLAGNDVAPNTKCKPKGLLKVTVSDKILYRYIKINNEDILITPENLSQYKGQQVEMYSPLFCTYGTTYFCNRCAGELHRHVLNSKQIGITAASVISEFLYTKLLKSMHTGAMGQEYAVSVDRLLSSIIEHNEEEET